MSPCHHRYVVTKQRAYHTAYGGVERPPQRGFACSGVGNSGLGSSGWDPQQGPDLLSLRVAALRGCKSWRREGKRRYPSSLRVRGQAAISAHYGVGAARGVRQGIWSAAVRTGVKDVVTRATVYS